MDNYPGKPGPKPGRIKETRAENERLHREIERLQYELGRIRQEGRSAPEPKAPAPVPVPETMLGVSKLAEAIFIQRAAHLKMEGFPDDALRDADAQRPVVLFWEKLRDHCLLAAATFYSEADPQPGEEIAEAPPENAHNSETDGPRHDHD